MRLRVFHKILIAAVVAAMSGCVSTAVPPLEPAAEHSFQALISERLYFGRNIPSGGTVSESDWKGFLADIVTPRFPAGLSVWRTEGQWRDKSGVIDKEEGFVLEILHPDDAVSEKAIQEVMTEYKTRFKQEAVLRIRDSVRAQFW